MAGSRNPTYLEVQDTNALKVAVALRRNGPVARGLAKILNSLNQCGEMDVRSYCINVLDYTREDYKKAFYQEEQKILQNSTPFEDLDITLIYKLLQRICGLSHKNDNSWSKKAEDTGCLEHSLFLLKEKRNIFFHYTTSMSEEEMHKEFGEIIGLLKSTFTKTGEKVDMDLTQESEEVEKELCDLLASPLPAADLKDYLKTPGKIINGYANLGAKAVDSAASEAVVFAAKTASHVVKDVGKCGKVVENYCKSVHSNVLFPFIKNKSKLNFFK